ncbi:cell wall elongation regulator TseB-like domain-containing protein [Bacillus solitudinis]|uniref:cell wall elongation regulator TseB-like domain-containing protein n=1 Tax=Bacillus solitudinis TaxID=2014074 RepID=UPI000C23DEDD|nr:DUF5590 domain-containing protein [Bacillus solitudinis]
MKKWIIISCIMFFLLSIGLGTLAYYVMREPLEKGYEQAQQYVFDQNLLNDIHSITYYHGTESYYVLHGFNEENVETIVWLNQNFEEVVSRKASEGITPEEAREIVKNDVNLNSIQTVRLGVERNLPIYEVLFVDEANRQGYYYITFDDGTFMKRYSLKRDDV